MKGFRQRVVSPLLSSLAHQAPSLHTNSSVPKSLTTLARSALAIQGFQQVIQEQERVQFWHGFAVAELNLAPRRSFAIPHFLQPWHTDIVNDGIERVTKQAITSRRRGGPIWQQSVWIPCSDTEWRAPLWWTFYTFAAYIRLARLARWFGRAWHTDQVK